MIRYDTTGTRRRAIENNNRVLKEYRIADPFESHAYSPCSTAYRNTSSLTAVASVASSSSKSAPRPPISIPSELSGVNAFPPFAAPVRVSSFAAVAARPSPRCSTRQRSSPGCPSRWRCRRGRIRRARPRGRPRMRPNPRQPPRHPPRHRPLPTPRRLPSPRAERRSRARRPRPRPRASSPRVVPISISSPRGARAAHPRDHVQLRAQRGELRAVSPSPTPQIGECIGAEAPRERRERVRLANRGDDVEGSHLGRRNDVRMTFGMMRSNVRRTGPAPRRSSSGT